MRTRPLESSIMLAGLTRGLWTGLPADQYPQPRETWADAENWRSALLSDEDGGSHAPCRAARAGVAVDVDRI